MSPVVYLVALLTTGIDVGWQPLETGGTEFIIQIEPELVEILADGQHLVSTIPPAAGDVRRIRVTAGNGQLPRQGSNESQVAVDREAPKPDPSALRVETSRATDDELPTEVVIMDSAAEVVTETPENRVPFAGQDEASLASDLATENDPSVEVPGLEPDYSAMTAEHLESTETPSGAKTRSLGQRDSRSLGSGDTSLADTTTPVATGPTESTVDDAETRRVERTVGYRADQISAGPTTIEDQAAVARDSWWLPAVLIALFGSIGANVFLSWTTWGTRVRYLALVKHMRQAEWATSEVRS